MYYKDVEDDFPSYEFGASREEMMNWMKTPLGIITSLAIVALIVFIVYWFFFKDSAPRYSYY